MVEQQVSVIYARQTAEEVQRRYKDQEDMLTTSTQQVTEDQAAATLEALAEQTAETEAEAAPEAQDRERQLPIYLGESMPAEAREEIIRG